MKRQIMCICGSVRFKDSIMQEACRFSLMGHIVLIPNCLLHEWFHNSPLGRTAKVELDKLHFDKIRLADFVYVVNEDGYIGDSTSREIEFAKSLRKPIRYMEEEVLA